MKKIAKIIYSAAFFGICCIPLAAMPFTKDSGNIEKKELTEKPKLVTENKLNRDFSEHYEKWFNDRLPFRSQILTGANFIKSEIIKAPTANVISGKDGWLFFEETAADYMDTNAMSEEQLKSIGVTLSLIQENVKEKNGNFTFVPMPNKNSVYGEYMPDCYNKAEENNLTRLYGVLDEYGVNYVNMKKLLTDNKDMGLYHKRDTHWNYMGALLGYNSIMDSLGKEHKTYNSAQYNVTKSWTGDLDKLLFPNGGFKDDQYSFDITYEDFRFIMPAGVTDTKAQLENFMSDKEDNDNRFRTAKTTPAGSGNLYMVRDSFGRALLPFMIDNYDTAMFVRTTCPEMNMVGNGSDMVYEIVERNLRNLVHTAPFMTAPVREISVNGEKQSDNNKVYTSDETYGLRIYGVLDKEFVSDDARIYVKLENDKNSYTYEAFPIYESGLLNDQSKDKNGFSAILDKNNIESGEYSVSLISSGVSSGKIESINIKGE